MFISQSLLITVMNCVTGSSTVSEPSNPKTMTVHHTVVQTPLRYPEPVREGRGGSKCENTSCPSGQKHAAVVSKPISNYPQYCGYHVEESERNWGGIMLSRWRLITSQSFWFWCIEIHCDWLAIVKESLRNASNSEARHMEAVHAHQ